VDLATVPEQKRDAIAVHGFDAVCFMPGRDRDLHAKRRVPREFQEGPRKIMREEDGPYQDLDKLLKKLSRVTAAFCH
jgi:hypothetical protein